MSVTATKPAPPPVDTPPLNPYRWFILVGLVLATLMEVLDTTVVNVALPQMMGNFGATTDEIGWVSTGYILSNVVVLPITAWLSHRFGRRNYLAVSIIIFVVASFFCGMSHSLIELVFWRICQGAGGAALLSTAQATIMEIFPRDQMGTVTAFFGVGMIMGPTLAPALGGWITDNYSWPWVFFINIPIGIVSLWIVLSFLQNSIYQRNTAVVDWAGIGLLAVGLASLQYVLEEGLRYDWFNSPMICRLTALSITCLVTFVIWELSPRNKHPVIEMHVLKNGSLRVGIILGMLLGFGLYGGTFVYPLFVQQILHFNAISTGLTLLPGGIASGIAMQICGRMINKKGKPVDPRRLLVIGVVTFVASMYFLSRSTSQSGSLDAQFALCIRGASMGFLFMPLNTSVFRSLSGPDIAQGSSILNLSRQLGGSLGIAILNTYIVNMVAFHRSRLSEHITSTSPVVHDRVSDLTGMFVAHGVSLDNARAAAMGVIGNSVSVQASTMAYDNAFALIGLAMLVAAPSILLLRPKMLAAASMGR